MSYPQNEAKIEWTPVEEIERKLEERLRPQREEARLKAEQDAIEAKRKLELFVKKGTLANSEPLAIEICERISSGELLINICIDPHMPTVRRVNQWLSESIEFKGLYGASINDRLNIFEEEIIQISDDVARDFKEITRNGRTVRVIDGEAIARAKLRVETRLKHLRAYGPERWAEQSTLITKSVDALIRPTCQQRSLRRRLLISSARIGWSGLHKWWRN
jgi:hypothetical protein